MYQRIKASLINPKKIVDYIEDKFVVTMVYVLIFAIIFSLPYIFVLRNVEASFKSSIRKTLLTEDIIEYEIKDAKLLSTSDSAKTYVLQMKDISINNVYIVVGDNLITESFEDLNTSMFIQFSTDGIYFGQAALIDTRAKILDYDSEYIDFRKINNTDLTNVSRVLSYVDKFIEQNKTLIYTFIIPGIFVYSVLEILFTTLMSSVILVLFFNKYGIKFKQIYKIALYCSLPTVLGLLLSVLLSSIAIGPIFNHIGFFATTCYAIIALNELVKQKIINNKEENNNESI